MKFSMFIQPPTLAPRRRTAWLAESTIWPPRTCSKSMSDLLGSALDRAGGQARNDVPLGEQVEDDRWRHREGDESQHARPVRAELALVLHDSQRQRVELLTIERQQR